MDNYKRTLGIDQHAESREIQQRTQKPRTEPLHYSANDNQLINDKWTVSQHNVPLNRFQQSQHSNGYPAYRAHNSTFNGTLITTYTANEVRNEPIKQETWNSVPSSTKLPSISFIFNVFLMKIWLIHRRLISALLDKALIYPQTIEHLKSDIRHHIRVESIKASLNYHHQDKRVLY
jgi:hypothetical protein